MKIDTIDAIAQAFETGVRDMSTSLDEILTELIEELSEQHLTGAEHLDQPALAVVADMSEDGYVGVTVRFGEIETIKNAPADAMKFRLDGGSTYAELADDVRSLQPMMCSTDYIVSLLHRARPRLVQQQKHQGVAA